MHHLPSGLRQRLYTPSFPGSNPGWCTVLGRLAQVEERRVDPAKAIGSYPISFMTKPLDIYGG